MRIRVLSALTMAHFLGLACCAYAQPQYSIIDLGQTSGFIGASDVNSLGWVGGNIGAQPAIWRDGSVELMGVLQGYSSSVLLGLNDIGYAAGYSQRGCSCGHTEYRASLYTPSGPVDLGFSTIAYAVNNSLQVVGSNGHGLIWQNGQIAILPDLGFSAALDINEQGDVVGYTHTDPSAPNTAALWRQGQFIDLNPPGSSFSEAWAINGNGDVVGQVGQFGAVKWDANGSLTQLIDIQTPGFFGRASGINDSGQIVGSFTSNGMHSAFLWQNDSWWRLGDVIDPAISSQWDFSDGTDNKIGNNGRISGFARHNGNPTAFVLIPVSEPPSYILLFSSVFGIIVIRKIRQAC